jgi:8-oxo-dGTP pyrophosphatase MutT (NUDIX family)
MLPVFSIDIKCTRLSVQIKKYNTAGVVCFSIDPRSHKVYLLLGRETVFRDLLSTAGVWCDFGGKINTGESVEDAAAREFSEESMCVVRLFESDKSVLGEYYMKISIILPPTNGVEHVRVYFVKEVPWQENVQHDFQQTREQLLRIKTGQSGIHEKMTRHPAVIRHGVIDSHFIEKVEIKWWGLDQLKCIIRNNVHGFKQDRFRRSFLPALRIIVKTLGSHVHDRETNTFAKVK